MKSFTALFMMMICSASAAPLVGPVVLIEQPGSHPSPVSRLADDRMEPTIPFGGGKLVNIPPVMRKEFYYQFPQVPDKASIVLRCTDNSDHIGCEFFVNVYHCPGCSSAVNGALPGSMTAAGHQGGSCAPGFTVPDLSDEFVQPMVAFRVTVEAGTEIKLPAVVGDAKYISIFGSFHENVCMWRTPHACEEPGVCTVEGSTCVPAHFCPKVDGSKPKGPDARICPRNCLAPKKKNEDEPEEPSFMIPM